MESLADREEQESDDTEGRVTRLSQNRSDPLMSTSGRRSGRSEDYVHRGIAAFHSPRPDAGIRHSKVLSHLPLSLFLPVVPQFYEPWSSCHYSSIIDGSQS